MVEKNSETLPGTRIVGFFSSSQLYDAATLKSEILFSSSFPTTSSGLDIEPPTLEKVFLVFAILTFKVKAGMRTWGEEKGEVNLRSTEVYVKRQFHATKCIPRVPAWCIPDRCTNLQDGGLTWSKCTDTRPSERILGQYIFEKRKFVKLFSITKHGYPTTQKIQDSGE